MGESLGQRLLSFARDPLFSGDPELIHGPNPYRRMLDHHTLSEADFSLPPTADQWSSRRALAAHRLLGTFYEADTVLLPEQGLTGMHADFDRFYGEELRTLRESSVSALERFAFGCLSDAVDVSGAVTPDLLDAYFQHVLAEAQTRRSAAIAAVAEARDRRTAADLHLAQLALDGLTEASAMSRNLGGAYGPEQSALFKIMIDEFGYGVHDAKHTTIFAKLLDSRSMRTHVHAYWNFYLPGVLAAHNHHYYLSRDHAQFFRYAGAVTYTEAVFVPAIVQMASTYREIFGSEIDLHYCDEHAHTDQHHGRITRDQVLMSLAGRHGQTVIPELMRGIAEARLVAGWAEHDTAEQIRWSDDLAGHRELAGSTATTGTPRRVDLAPEAPFATRNHDDAMVLEVERGEVDLITTPTGPAERLRHGDALLIPAGRLYGVTSVSSTSAYLLHTAVAG